MQILLSSVSPQALPQLDACGLSSSSVMPCSDVKPQVMQSPALPWLRLRPPIPPLHLDPLTCRLRFGSSNHSAPSETLSPEAPPGSLIPPAPPWSVITLMPRTYKPSTALNLSSPTSPVGSSFPPAPPLSSHSALWLCLCLCLRRSSP